MAPVGICFASENPDELGDALEVLYRGCRGRGAEVVGAWPTAGDDYQRSRADLGDGAFCGLVLDQANQADLTPQRQTCWVESVRAQLLAAVPPARVQGPYRPSEGRCI